MAENFDSLLPSDTVPAIASCMFVMGVRPIFVFESDIQEGDIVSYMGTYHKLIELSEQDGEKIGYFSRFNFQTEYDTESGQPPRKFGQYRSVLIYLKISELLRLRAYYLKRADGGPVRKTMTTTMEKGNVPL